MHVPRSADDRRPATSANVAVRASARPCFLSLPSVEILQFLDLHAAVQLLNTCRTLRTDRVLSTSVLVRVPCAQHFFEDCAADWWHATPLWKTSIYNSELVVDEIDSDWEDDQLLAGQVDDCHVSARPTQQQTQHHPPPPPRSPLSYTATAASSLPTSTADGAKWQTAVRAMPQWQHVPLLSLIDFVLERILPQCYIPFKYASAVYTARPVLIALPLASSSCHDNDARASIVPPVLLQDDLERALNAVQSGFGSAFVRPTAPLTSLFGVHWDNMTLEHGHVTCATCGLYAQEVQTYQERVQSMVRAWRDAVADLVPQWKAEGLHQMAIDKRTYELREAMIPYGGYYNSNIARRHGDIIIQHVCANWSSLDAVAIDALGCKDPSQLLLALTADIRKQCHHFRKLQRAMRLAFADRIQRLQYTLGDPAVYLNMWHEELTTELVAGVAAAGFVCGFLLVEKGE